MWVAPVALRHSGARPWAELVVERVPDVASTIGIAIERDCNSRHEPYRVVPNSFTFIVAHPLGKQPSSTRLKTCGLDGLPTEARNDPATHFVGEIVVVLHGPRVSDGCSDRIERLLEFYLGSRAAS